MKKSVALLLLLIATANAQTPRLKSMVRIPGATFQMGTDASKVSEIAAAFNISKHPELIEAETPQHTVTLSPFYLDKYEVTNSDFQKFIKRNPQWRRVRTASSSDRIINNQASVVDPVASARGSDSTRVHHNGNYLKDWTGLNFPKGKANHPVVNVSWYAAVAFCQSQGKRLPTEAEWEYAARGGLQGKTFPWGDEPLDYGVSTIRVSGWAKEDGLVHSFTRTLLTAPNAQLKKTRANYSGSGINTTTPVGSYAPNGYGLFDMAGNVWEFLADEWGRYSAQAQLNPVAGGDLYAMTVRSSVYDGSRSARIANLVFPESFLEVKTRRVIRGGSFAGAPLNLRVTYRDSHPPDGAREFVGFRCAARAM